MPLTPFHFGPGGVLHVAAPRHMSFLAFCAANVLIDVEPLAYMLADAHPWHRFFHTFVGAAVITAATTAAFRVARRFGAGPGWFGWRTLAFRPVLFGAALGAFSHVVLDSLMHPDIRPFAPWSEANSLLELVSRGWLYAGCLAAGVAATCWVLVRRVLAGRAP